MANGFAGAGQSAHRRRRRLSHDVSDDAEFTIESEAAPSATNQTNTLWKSEFDTQLLKKVLSPELWKHVTAIAFIMLLTAVAIYQISVGFHSVLSHTFSRIASCFLLAAGQLALLIAWIRSESDFDYKGRYRWWKFLAIALLTAAVLRLTDLTTWAGKTVISLAELATGPLESARLAILLVPLVVSGVLLAYRIIPDMQRCFESQIIMVLAAVTVLLAATWQSLGFADTDRSVVASLDLSVSILFFSSLVLHARYVAYVNHDPPVLIQNSVTEAVTQPSRTQVENAELTLRELKCPAEEGFSEDTGNSEVPAAPVESAPRKPRQKKRRKTRRAA